MYMYVHKYVRIRFIIFTIVDNRGGNSLLNSLSYNKSPVEIGLNKC